MNPNGLKRLVSANPNANLHMVDVLQTVNISRWMMVGGSICLREISAVQSAFLPRIAAGLSVPDLIVLM